MHDDADRTKAELGQFGKLWRGGYFEGDPLDRMGASGYNRIGFNSVLYTTYVACIKPYVRPETTVLEIGPGRGGWTRSILHCNPKKIFALDAAPPEHTGFWEYVGRDPRISYITVKDFTLSDVPSNSIDYFFSFGVFCHIPPALGKEYLINLFSRMKPGAHGFLMVADFEKYNRAAANLRNISTRRALAGRVMLPIRWVYDLLDIVRPQQNVQPISEEAVSTWGSGRWHNYGVDAACADLQQAGFAILDRDTEVNARDPVIHFGKECSEKL